MGVSLLYMLLLNERNLFVPRKHLFSRRKSFEEMQDHRYLCLQRTRQTWSNTFWTVFSPPAKFSSSLCRHKLIRSTEVCKQRTVSNTLVCNPPTWYAAAQVKYQTHTFLLSPSSSASHGLLAYHVQHLNYSCGMRVGAKKGTGKRKGFVRSCINCSWTSRHVDLETN